MVARKVNLLCCVDANFKPSGNMLEFRVKKATSPKGGGNRAPASYLNVTDTKNIPKTWFLNCGIFYHNISKVVYSSGCILL